jgi:FtsZ-interacting cell division protein YlmF
VSEFWHSTKEFFGFTANERIEEKPLQVTARKSVLPGLRGSLVHFPQNKSLSPSEIMVMEPRSCDDSLKIASHILEGKPVFINLKYLDTANGRQLINFVSGATYAMKGHMMRIADNTFLFTPANILINDCEDRSNLEKGLENAEKEVFFKRQAAGY